MNLNKLNLFDINSINPSKIESSKNDIAVIGVSTQIGMAKTKDEFWNAICEGRDFIKKFPEERIQDAQEIYENIIEKPMKAEPFEAAYLDRVDLFDANYFRISPTEAEYMDPNQRLFLEAAWSTIQDAGYDPVKLKGSSIGIYLGYTSDENSYIGARHNINEFTYGVAVSGNVNSIIASRISYLLDLKGPAMSIDTACSSSLVALHMACQQIISGEVSSALVGGIRLVIAPLQDASKTIGIESSSRRTKTFDESADGTGGGEGVICVMIKRLEDALEDQDNIYAIVKGSAINQDGASIGITAPNAKSQAEVIKSAWERAKIDPETISYIEAHGTATKLGDPVEISGIEQAFSEYTDKKQFCAIGSVKSNVGHLDCAAGLAGFVKAVLMLKYKMLPPTIHFQSPNPNIDFIHSPVYINDKLRKWKSDEIRRCGISSFGISGTNCHVILEEAPVQSKEERFKLEREYLVTISAKSKTALQHSVELYCDYLLSNKMTSFDDFCYTLNVGRGDYNYRIAVICKNSEEFIEMISDSLFENKRNYYFGEHRVVEQVKDSNEEIYITEETKQVLTGNIKKVLERNKSSIQQTEMLYQIAQLYVQGGDIDWDIYYDGIKRRISIPTYPFEQKRYWIKENKQGRKEQFITLHPYIDKCITDTQRLRIYEKKMSVNECWELRDHKINDVNVLPGTAFIEIAQYIGTNYYKNESFEIDNLIYLTPLSGEEERILHVIVHEKSSYLQVECHSKSSGNWTSHVEFTIHKGRRRKQNMIKIDEVRKRCRLQSPSQKSNQSMVKIEGEGWNNVQDIFSGEQEILISFQLDSKLEKVKKNYLLFPPMLDPAINGGTYLVEDEYLPFSFDKASFYQKMPDSFYSYIKIKEKDNPGFICFDIYLCRDNGEVFAEIDNYRIKRIDNPTNFLLDDSLKQGLFHRTEWTISSILEVENVARKKYDNVLVLAEQEDINDELLNEIETTYRCRTWIVNSLLEIELMEQKDFEKLDLILYVARSKQDLILEYEQLKINTEFELGRAYKLIKQMIQCQVRREIDIIFLTKHAAKVLELEENVNPLARALIGFASCINLEHKNFNARVIDWDYTTSISRLVKEMGTTEESFMVAMRNNCKYIERMVPVITTEVNEKKWLREQGIYVITGGLGGMGLALTRYIFQQEPSSRVILLNRSYSMKEFLDSNAVSSLDYEKSKEVQYLLSQGFDINIKKVNVSDYEQLEQVIAEVHQQYGRINGVIHAAGVKGDGFIINRTWEEFEQVLQPKIYGTCALDILTREDDLDFFVMCSSITSIFGEPGQSQYTAANAFLNSYCNCYRKNAENFITIDWTGWNESGMAVDNGVEEENVYVKFLNNSLGAQAFERAITLGLNRIIVGKFKEDIVNQDYTRYSQFIKLDFTEKESSKFMSNSETSTFESLTITGKSLSEITKIEKNVISAWANTLGVTEIDVNDKFFESGGNSLLASYLHKEISNFYPGVLVITDVFMYSTIEEIATFIDGKLNGPLKEIEIIEEESKEDDVDDLVKKFLAGEISREGLESLL